jgi:hypothetical protein
VPVEHIHTYLVNPGRGQATVQQINGATVPLTGKMFELLDGIYTRSEQECDIDIIFQSTNGSKQNACRDLICAHIGSPTLPNGKLIAERLQANTDRRAGPGLLFLIVGKEGRDHKIVISRFPTDSAILVEENPKSLDVEFLERVFMKNKTSYKAVLYRDSSMRGGFWDGKAIDKQTNPTGESADYWIADFLLSDFTVTPKQGTHRLAATLRAAAKNADFAVKQEIASVAALAKSLPRQSTSISDFVNRFNFSAPTRAAIFEQLKNPGLAQERFQFSAPDFASVLAYRSMELDNGAMLTAPSAEFDDVFHQEVVSKLKKEVRFTTQGTVVDDKLKPRA